jgi:hypothetical protein
LNSAKRIINDKIKKITRRNMLLFATFEEIYSIIYLSLSKISIFDFADNYTMPYYKIKKAVQKARLSIFLKY